MNLAPGVSEPPRGEAAELHGEAKANNAFTADLLRQVGKQEGNVFCSPFSIRTALSMVQAGAAGPTDEVMRKTLHFGVVPERHAATARLAARLMPAGKASYDLKVANAIWVQRDFPLNDSFTSLLAKDYRTQSQSADFEKEMEKSRLAINTWVEGQTKDKIKELLKPNVLDLDTKLVLVNAIYFKGNWTEPFKTKNTKDETFYLTGGKETKAPLMTQHEDFRYHETDDLQLVRLPYEKCPLDMVVLLPRRKDGLANLEKSLTAETLAAWNQAARLASVTLFLPKFKQTAEFDLGATLSQMGMPTAFTNFANFSGISSARKLKIDKVIHKAFVEVNEEGTEAAAATGISIMPTSMPAPKKQVAFRADHPFLYLIQDRDTGAILFVGRCAEPGK